MRISLSLSALALATSLSASAVAQDFLSQGTMYVAGSGQLTSTRGEVEANGQSADLADTSTFTVSPHLGYFVTPEIAVEGVLNYEVSSEDGEDNITRTGAEAALLLRGLYHVELQPNLALYGLAFLGTQSTLYRLDGPTGDAENEGRFTLYGGGAGLVFFTDGPVGGFARGELNYVQAKGELDAESYATDLEYTMGTVQAQASFGIYF